MTRRRDKIRRINLFRKRVEDIWSVHHNSQYSQQRKRKKDEPFSEEIKIKHLLRIIQIPILLFQSRVETILASEIGDTARSRYSRPGEDENLFRLSDEVDRVGRGIVLRELLPVSETV